MILNTDLQGRHIIAINQADCAVIRGHSLITIATKAEFDCPVSSVVAMDEGFVVLLEDGSVYTVQNLLKERIFDGNLIRSIAVGCGNLIFGVTEQGRVLIDDGYEKPVNFGSFHDPGEVFESCALKSKVLEWDDVVMVAATSKHVVAVRGDRKLTAAGASSAIKDISLAKEVRSISLTEINSVNLTFVIHHDGSLSVYGGQTLQGHSDYVNEIEALHGVTDVTDCQGGTLVRFDDGAYKWITYYGRMNYYEWIGLTDKYPDFVFAEVSSPYMALVTPDGIIHAVREGTGSFYEADDFEVSGFRD